MTPMIQKIGLDNSVGVVVVGTNQRTFRDFSHRFLTVRAAAIPDRFIPNRVDGFQRSLATNDEEEEDDDDEDEYYDKDSTTATNEEDNEEEEEEDLYYIIGSSGSVSAHRCGSAEELNDR